MFSVFRNTFPDAHMEVGHAGRSGRGAFISGHFKGTNTGELVGPDDTVPHSGNALGLAYADYFRVVDGKTVAHETFFAQMTCSAKWTRCPTPDEPPRPS